MKIGTICSGMGMAIHGLGDSVWGIECDSDIASVYAKNHPQSRLICDYVQNVIPSSLDDVDAIIATPSCKNASNANPKAGESPEDIAVAKSVAAIVKAKLPKFFILENVEGYKKFEGFSLIQGALKSCGYCISFQTLNLKDFGIAQNRKRLYLMALLGESFADIHPPNTRKGWYEAIADLLPSLPTTQLTKTQQGIGTGDRLIRRIGSTKSNNRPYSKDEPIFTIRAFGRNCSNHWHQADAIVDHQVKAVTPKACLRFFGDKTTADSIWLPNRKSLAMEVVGNGASWQIMQLILKQMGGDICPTGS